MKAFSFFLLMVLLTKAEAQLPKKFLPIADQYFISLPYGNTFPDWFERIYTNKSVKIDSAFELTDTTRVFLAGHILIQTPAFPKADSTTIIIGRNYNISQRRVNGSVTNQDTATVYYLSQIFFFPKDSINDNDWKELSKNTIKTFRKFFSILYPVPSGDSKNRIPGEVLWFSNPGEIAPTIIMRYGQSQRRPDCHFLWLQLNFSIVPS